MGRLAVSDLMTADVVTLPTSAGVDELRDVMYDHDVRHVPIVDSENDLIGLVSHRDLLRHMVTDKADVPIGVQRERLHSMSVSDIMTPDVVTAEAEQDLREAAATMLDGKFGCLPVVDGGRIVGILTESDFVRHVVET